MVKTCKCCGQALPPPLFALLGLSFRAEPWRLIEAVHAAGESGISTEQLFFKMYGDDPDGGPGTGFSALSSRIAAINRRLRTVGWEMSADRPGAAGVLGRYTLHKVNDRERKQRVPHR